MGDEPRLVRDGGADRDVTITLDAAMFRKASALAAEHDTTVEELCQSMVNQRIEKMPLEREVSDE